MNPLAWLNPGRWLLLLALAAALIGGGALLKARYDDALREQGRQEVLARTALEREAFLARNRELQRAAEIRYTVVREGQDRFFVTTIKEIEHAAAPLATCPLPESLRLRLNAAASCARGDSPSSCGAADEVPGAR